MGNKLKKIASILIMLAFFMPLSKCSTQLYQEGEEQRISETITYAYSAYEWPSIESTAVLLAFFWPLLLLLASARMSGLNNNFIINIGEILFSVGSVIIIIRATFLSELLYGAYIVLAALITYFMVTVLQMYKLYLNRGAANQI